jgi:predicted HNH restriction endonuclease
MSPTRKKRTVEEEPKWDQETAFPIIGSIIEGLHGRDRDRFISKREIVPILLLPNGHSRKLIEAAYERKHGKQSIEKYAGNMVQWFSQKWTVDDEKWSSLFKKFKRSEKRTDGCWAYKPIAPSAVIIFPDEVEEDVKGLPEGAVFQRLVNAYERNPLARQKCIDKYGTSCCICGFSFGTTYGEAADGLIHVHHLLQLSKVGKNYKVDPIADLRPVCPNCHAVIHHRNPSYSVEEVQALVANLIK